MLSSREPSQEEANQDQMEPVFQQQHVVAEIKEKCGLRPNAALGVPQTCSLWGISQTRGGETGRHLPERSVYADCSAVLEREVWRVSWQKGWDHSPPGHMQGYLRSLLCVHSAEGY